MRHPLALAIALALLALPLAGCGNDSGGNGLVGSYSMDGADFLQKMEEMMLEQAGPMLEQMPPEQVEKMKEQMLEGMKDSRVDMEIKADGTFEVKAKMQGDTDVITGTWSQEGDVITFIEKEENGKPKEDGETIKATMKDGNLLLKPDQEMPFDLIMKKN